MSHVLCHFWVFSRLVHHFRKNRLCLNLCPDSCLKYAHTPKLASHFFLFFFRIVVWAPLKIRKLDSKWFNRSAQLGLQQCSFQCLLTLILKDTLWHEDSKKVSLEGLQIGLACKMRGAQSIPCKKSELQACSRDMKWRGSHRKWTLIVCTRTSLNVQVYIHRSPVF